MTSELACYATLSINLFKMLECSELPISKDTADIDTPGVS